MARILLALLAAVSVFWHTVAGCCAHHDHFAAGWMSSSNTATASSSSSSSRAPSPSTGARCCHGHSRHRIADRAVASNDADKTDRTARISPSTPVSAPQEHDAPQEGAPCDDADCAFALTKHVTLPDAASLIVWATTAELGVVPHQATGPATVSKRAGQRTVWWPEKLRAHLALCVLRD